MVYIGALRMMVHKIHLKVGRKFFRLVHYLFTVSVSIFFHHVEAGDMLYRTDSDIHLQTNRAW